MVNIMVIGQLDGEFAAGNDDMTSSCAAIHTDRKCSSYGDVSMTMRCVIDGVESVTYIRRRIVAALSHLRLMMRLTHSVCSLSTAKVSSSYLFIFQESNQIKSNQILFAQIYHIT